MTFDHWWRDHGSLQNDIFNLSYKAREIFKRVSETAWNESEFFTKEEYSDLEEDNIKLNSLVDELKDEVESAKQQCQDALDDIETLKASIRSCL